jgi:hypothetical protein
MEVYLMALDRDFLGTSLVDGDCGGPGCGWSSRNLYVVRNNELQQMEVRRTPTIIYPAAYLHPEEAYPPDECGSSESITEALSRVNLSGADYVVLHIQSYGCVITEDSNVVYIAPIMQSTV